MCVWGEGGGDRLYLIKFLSQNDVTRHSVIETYDKFSNLVMTLH